MNLTGTMTDWTTGACVATHTDGLFCPLLPAAIGIDPRILEQINTQSILILDTLERECGKCSLGSGDFGIKQPRARY